MKWSAPLHFVNPVADHPPQICPFPGTKGWEGAKGANVLGAIRNTTDVLARWVQEGSNPADPVANEALRFLIHFAGDVHMPFHLVGRARGGNDVYVKWGGKKVSKYLSSILDHVGNAAERLRKIELHGLWDTNLVQRAIQNTPPKWATPLSSDIEKHLHGAKYDPLIRKTIIGGINGTWATSSKSWVQCPAISPFPSSRGDDQTVLESVWDPSETDGAFVCPWRWSAPIHQMACDWAWPKELDKPPYDAPNGPLLEMDTDQYAGKVAKEWVVEKLLAMAGIRLALILNLIFAPS